MHWPPRYNLRCWNRLKLPKQTNLTCYCVNVRHVITLKTKFLTITCMFVRFSGKADKLFPYRMDISYNLVLLFCFWASFISCFGCVLDLFLMWSLQDLLMSPVGLVCDPCGTYVILVGLVWSFWEFYVIPVGLVCDLCRTYMWSLQDLYVFIHHVLKVLHSCCSSASDFSLSMLDVFYVKSTPVLVC